MMKHNELHKPTEIGLYFVRHGGLDYWSIVKFDGTDWTVYDESQPYDGTDEITQWERHPDCPYRRTVAS